MSMGCLSKWPLLSVSHAWALLVPTEVCTCCQIHSPRLARLRIPNFWLEVAQSEMVRRCDSNGGG